jgi:hypothetical protein
MAHILQKTERSNNLFSFIRIQKGTFKANAEHSNDPGSESARTLPGALILHGQGVFNATGPYCDSGGSVINPA